MKRFIQIALTVALFTAVSYSQTFSFADMVKLRRVGDPQLSPDGRVVLYTVGDVDVKANRTNTQIYVVSTDGGEAKQLTKGDRSNSAPRWSPDGKRIAFTTGGQIWVMAADGSDKKQVTKISTGASGPVWSPDSKWLAFSSEVYPECKTDECNKAEDEKAENSKVQAKVTERLLFRHWTEWRDRKRTHVFVVPSSGGELRQVTQGDFDSPPFAASTGVDYSFSPDSSEIAVLRNPDKVEAISTNSDIFVYSLTGSSQKNITAANKGYDVSPVYTSDGKYIIYRSQATAGFEADRWRLMRYDRSSGTSVELTTGFDLQVEEFSISDDNQTIYFTALERGLSPVYSVPVATPAKPTGASAVKTLIQKGFNSNLNISNDGKWVIHLSSSLTAPAEVFKSPLSGSVGQVNLSNANGALSHLIAPESVDWKGALNKANHGFVVKPANFNPNKKYPLLVLIHGGPQSAWNNSWGYRWNPQVFANAGYVVFMPNPRGSVGYGQKFVNEISADWGGKVYTDIMNGVAEIVKRPYVDKERIGAAGASYGGYMVNWILGHNNDPRFKFKVLHSHAGVYNLESMATVTEELWFVDWEFKGLPWENPVNYIKWSPHRFARNFNTPTLVTHGELDFRVPIGEGLQLYTTLQRRNVDSKLVYFPDEGHWILKPQNSEFWYGQVLNWFGKYLKP